MENLKIDEPANVLIVDDDPVFLSEFGSFMERNFGSLIKSVDLAPSIAEAHRLFATNAYELVIADIDFSDRGEGRDAGLRVLSDFPNISPNIVIVLTTGKADVTTVFRGAKSGAFDFFAKGASLENEVIPRLHLAFAQVNQQRQMRRLTMTLSQRNHQIELYRRAALTAAQLVLSVALAILSLSWVSSWIRSDLLRTSAFFVVLVFCALFFEVLKRFAVRIGNLDISGGGDDARK